MERQQQNADQDRREDAETETEDPTVPPLPIAEHGGRRHWTRPRVVPGQPEKHPEAVRCGGDQPEPEPSSAEGRSRTGNNYAEEDGGEDQADPGDGDPQGTDLAGAVLQAVSPQVLCNTNGTGPGVARRVNGACGGDLVEIVPTGMPSRGRRPRPP